MHGILNIFSDSLTFSGNLLIRLRILHQQHPWMGWLLQLYATFPQSQHSWYCPWRYCSLLYPFGRPIAPRFRLTRTPPSLPSLLLFALRARRILEWSARTVHLQNKSSPEHYAAPHRGGSTNPYTKETTLLPFPCFPLFLFPFLFLLLIVLLFFLQFSLFFSFVNRSFVFLTFFPFLILFYSLRNSHTQCTSRKHKEPFMYHEFITPSQSPCDLN